MGRPAVGPLCLPSGEIIQDPCRMCEVFAASFSGVFVSAAPAHPAFFQLFAGNSLSRLGVLRVLLALDPLNYRPVSLTLVCCQLMERIVVSQLTEYLESSNILSSQQYGFLEEP